METLDNNKNIDAELRIKEAAKKLFQRKGFAGTKTRDIAEEANINLALLNYYFRSKKKLFDIIMLETISGFFSGMNTVLNDTKTNPEEKLHFFVAHYIDFMIENPDVPNFIMNEVRNNPEEYTVHLGIAKQIRSSVFTRQFFDKVASQGAKAIDPLHFLMNLSGLVAFPFVSAPMLKITSGISDDDFNRLMQERKSLIPKWIKMMMEAN